MAKFFSTVSLLWKRQLAAAAKFMDAAKLVFGNSSGCASVSLAVFTAGTLWLGAWYMADQDAARTQSAAYDETANLTRAFEENIIRLIQAYDQILLFARSSYTADPHNFNLIKWAQEQHFVTDAALQLVIIKKSGFLEATTLGMPKDPLYLGDREHFRVHVNDTRDFLYIGPPVLGRLSKKWSIPMSRRIFGPDGSFEGVIHVVIDPAYLAKFFDSIDVRKRGMVLLAGLDGIVRVRASADDRAIGQSILAGALFSNYLSHTDSGSYLTSGRLDGIKRFSSYRKVRGYPLVVVVGIARSVALANVTYHRILYYGTAALMSALIFMLTTMIVRRQNRLHRAAAKLWEAANFDHLTKIQNRNRFNEKVLQLLAPANGQQRQFALLLIDLDNFKVVNDTLGHEAGDLVLREIARRLRKTACSSDLIARLGGDEFALLALDSTPSDLQVLAQQVLRDLRRKIEYRGQSIEICVSIGVAFSPSHGSTWGDVFRAADLALYQAKKRGRNRSMVFEPQMLAELEKRFDVLGSVRSAIEQHKVVPYYQPQVCVQSGEIVGFEALARIVESGGRVRMPEEFLSALEDREVSYMFGQTMIETVCRDLQFWLENGICTGRVAINSSTFELRADDYADRVIAALQIRNLSAERIEIEITENVALDGNTALIEANLNQLRERGVSISLDDFGTGYASLTHIKSLPIRSVKIDRAFIANIVQDAESQAIVKAIVRLSHDLGKSVIAEGVDNQAQMDILRELRCDLAQGFLISEPIPFSEIPTFMLRHLVRARISSATPQHERPVAVANRV